MLRLAVDLEGINCVIFNQKRGVGSGAMIRVFFAKLLGWCRRLQEWVAEAKIGLLGLLFIVLALALSLVVLRTESAIRCTGYALQLVGMVLAIRGLVGIRQFFGKPSIWSVVTDWFKRFPKWKNTQVIELGGTSHVMTGRRVFIEIWANDDPSLTVEQRLDAIVRNQERLREEQRQQEKSLISISDSLEDHKKKTEAEHNRVSREFNTRLESLHTNELTLSLVGLVFLTVGITLGTLSPEIFNWLQ